jgi:hypothetical protein
MVHCDEKLDNLKDALTESYFNKPNSTQQHDTRVQIDSLNVTCIAYKANYTALEAIVTTDTATKFAIGQYVVKN